MTVEDLLSRTTSAEIALWRAFMAIEPIGNLRGDFQAAVIASAVVNSAPRRHGRAFMVDDFLYFTDKEPPTRKEKAAKLRGQMQELEAGMNERKRRRGNSR